MKWPEQFLKKSHYKSCIKCTTLLENFVHILVRKTNKCNVELSEETFYVIDLYTVKRFFCVRSHSLEVSYVINTCIILSPYRTLIVPVLVKRVNICFVLFRLCKFDGWMVCGRSRIIYVITRERLQWCLRSWMELHN